ncbi:MAG: glycosyl transferase, family 39 [Acidobacteria bacterium]|nr:glycosyl transferase, family 39 [Acidobacteriota bacterium]
MHRKPAAIVALLISIACARMATTFRVFSATNDEATHVGGGLELIGQHQYRLQPENPPLARLVFSTLPWLGGTRFNPHGDFTQQLHSVFYGHGKYERNLFLARIGTLFFFVIAAAALAMWTHRELGSLASIIATLLFTTQPIILGYSALATHDGAATAGVAVSLLAMSYWLERRTPARAALLGAAFGFSVLCKFTCLAYVPLACAAIYVIRIARDGTLRRTLVRDLAAVIAIVPIVAAFVVWAGYGFTVSAFFGGLASIIRVNNAGFLSWAFGDVSMKGWWWYFPVAVLLKTTLALLLLLAIGPFFLREELAWRATEAAAAAVAILAMATRSTLDIGVRYVLPLYVPLTFTAATCALAMLRDRRRVMRGFAISLIAVQCIVSAIAHPDYFPFFNALAGREPSRYLIDSNIDWGQDVLRLRGAVRELHVARLGVSLMGPADLDALGFPPHFNADSGQATTGWIAISEHSLRMFGWSWLDGKPYRRIGRSIRLYYVRNQ